MMWVSRMCEEFHCLPSEALRERLIAPCGLLEEVLEVRAYTAAYFSVQAKDAPKGGTRPTPELELLVRQIEGELAAAEMARG